MMLILIGGTVGVVLGLRYKVFVLIPAMCVALAIVVLDAVAFGDGLGRIALVMFSIATSLQLGYILGGVVASTISPLRTRQVFAQARQDPASGRVVCVGGEGDVSLDSRRSECLHTLH
jgi:ethanolamine transporter EutH